MNIRVLSALVFGLALGFAASAQDIPPQPTQSQDGGGQRGGGRGGFGGGMEMGPGRGIGGTVTEVTADHYTVKTDAGETYTIHYSVNTRILKQPAGQRGPGGGGHGRSGEQGPGGNGFTPPQTIKPTDIKVGDAIGAIGEVDATTKSVGAIVVMQIDPERAKQMREMRENYGKTWIMGKVTAIDGVKVTLMGSMDNKAHTFVADEDTTFRKHREPITLADIQVGDNVRAEGAVKDGNFVASAVNALGQPAAGTQQGPRNGPSPQ